MASINYLWNNRAKFSPGSINFYRAWGKRLFCFRELIRRNSNRSKLTGKGAFIHETAEIGEADIDGKIKLLSIGKESFLGRVKIALHDEVTIGERVCINDGVEILTASHDVYDPEWKHVKSKIIIEDYVWIGTGAMILPGVVLGRGAVIGARAVVSKSVPAGNIVVGNPAKSITKTRPEYLNYNPCEFLAANRAWLVG
jgi:acetyltransferase-like isoleucine patch superfamily enzyme